MTLTVLEHALGNALLAVPLAALAWTIGRTRRNPSVAHFAWVLVMVRLVMPPIASMPWLSIQVPVSGVVLADPTAPHAAAPSALESRASDGPMGSVDGPANRAADPKEPAAQASADRSSEPQVAGSVLADGWTALGLLWLAGTAVVIAVSAVRLLRFRRMLRAARAPADPRVHRLAEMAAADLGMRLRAEIVAIPARCPPFVWSCFGRPCIVLPARIVAEMSDDALRLVLTHELGHVRRRDHLVRWLDWAVVAWLWWNPLAWIARRGLRKTEELACDALVLRAREAAARDYVNCLVSVAESIMNPAFRAPVQACTMGDGGSLEERIRLIMSGTLRTRPSAALRTLTLATAGASMLFGVAGANPSQAADSSQAASAAGGIAQDAAPATAQSTSGPGSSTRGSSSTSSTISFKKDGKTVSIEENGSGITVTVDGKSVRARDVDDLRQQHPDAYRLYVEKPGFAIGSAGGSASASGSRSSGSTKAGRPGSSETGASTSRDRSVTVTDDGKKISITENAAGITVTVDGKSTRASNADELRKESAEAFRLYAKHLDKPDARQEGPNASDLLREKLEEVRREKSDDPRLQGLIDTLLKELASAPADHPAAGAAPITAESTGGSGSGSSTRGSSSTSSSISFKKDGKLVSIQENGSGITVTVDGKRVRARDVDDLRQQHPDAYRLYAEKPGFAIGSAGGSASASGSRSSSSTRGSRPGSVETRDGTSRDRSVTVTDQGRQVTVAENASGITVAVGEKVVRARNADELKGKSAEAFELYERHLNTADARRGGTVAEDLLRAKLEEMRNETSGDPSLRGVIERLLKELDR